MFLEEYAEAINHDLSWTYRHNRHPLQRIYTVRFSGAFLRSKGMETYISGQGNTPENAKDDYVRHIRGQKLTLQDGREFLVPTNLEG